MRGRLFISGDFYNPGGDKEGGAYFIPYDKGNVIDWKYEESPHKAYFSDIAEIIKIVEVNKHHVKHLSVELEDGTRIPGFLLLSPKNT